MLTLSILSGLALAAFLAATPVPFQSEVAFVGAVAALPDQLWLLVLVASVANTAGSGVTYAMGRGARMFEPVLARWPRLRPDPAAMAKAERWFARWGRWVLLVSWLPGGDLACALAGALVIDVVEEDLSGACNVLHIVCGRIEGHVRGDGREIVAAGFFAAHALPEDMPPHLRGALPGWLDRARDAGV